RLAALDPPSDDPLQRPAEDDPAGLARRGVLPGEPHHARLPVVARPREARALGLPHPGACGPRGAGPMSTSMTSAVQEAAASGTARVTAFTIASSKVDPNARSVRLCRHDAH